MKKPANSYTVLEEFFCELRDSNFEAILLNQGLFEKAKKVINAELIGDEDGE